MHTQVLTYEADGLTMHSHLYLDDATRGARPAVLVFPEAFGLSDHTKARAERLASLGYTALACDLHGEGTLHDNFETIMSLMGGMKAEPCRIRARANAALQALAARPETDAARVAAIGYCFGGTMALELARGGAAVAGVVGFHSGLATANPGDAKNIKGRVLVCIGADDPSIDAEQRAAFEAEMRAGGVDWQMHLYGGVVHSFTNPGADRLGRLEFARYDAKADARSWAAMMALFNEIFAKPD